MIRSGRASLSSNNEFSTKGGVVVGGEDLKKKRGIFEKICCVFWVIDVRTNQPLVFCGKQFLGKLVGENVRNTRHYFLSAT
jgi:hypothetical protein